MISFGTNVMHPEITVSIVLTALDRAGEIVEIIDLPGDTDEQGVLTARHHARKLPRVHAVTRHDVRERLKQ